MTDYYATNASAAELRAILGDSWGICRATPKNQERYARCITKREYAAAVAEALRLRVMREEITRLQSANTGPMQQGAKRLPCPHPDDAAFVGLPCRLSGYKPA